MVEKDPVMTIFNSLPKVNNDQFQLMRPIVAEIGSLNKRSCKWVVSFIQPLVGKCPGK